MGSLISAAQKTAWQSVHSNIHDTFSLPIKVFKEGKDIILSTNPNYSHIYKQPLGNIQKQTNERTIQARIFYFPRKLGNTFSALSNEDAVKLEQPSEEVRLKVTTADFDFIKDADRFILDGHAYEKASGGTPNGLFGSGFYTIIIRRTA